MSNEIKRAELVFVSTTGEEHLGILQDKILTEAMKCNGFKRPLEAYVMARNLDELGQVNLEHAGFSVRPLTSQEKSHLIVVEACMAEAKSKALSRLEVETFKKDMGL